MKLLDIENTVERATRNAAATGATFLTVHAHDSKTLRAAVAGKAGTGLKILAVTVLTNLDAADIRQQGIDASPEELVARRAEARTRGRLRRRGCLGPGGGARARRSWAPAWPSSRRASGWPAARPATRRASHARRTPSPPAPTISWSGGRSARQATRWRRLNSSVGGIEAGLAQRAPPAARG